MVFLSPWATWLTSLGLTLALSTCGLPTRKALDLYSNGVLMTFKKHGNKWNEVHYFEYDNMVNISKVKVDNNNNSNNEVDNNNNNLCHSNRVVNSSRFSFSPPIYSLLEKGLNFSLTLKKISMEDIMCDIEFGIKGLPDNIEGYNTTILCCRP